MRHIVTQYDVEQGNDVDQKLKDPSVVEGDTISYEPMNQQGMVTYKVVMENGEKKLEKIYDYDDEYQGKKMHKKRKTRRTKRASTHSKRKAKRTSTPSKRKTIHKKCKSM